MAGVIITMVADRYEELIDHLIYLTANIPREQDRMIYMGKKLEQGGRSILLDALKIGFNTFNKGRLDLDKGLALKAFFNN